MKKITFVAVAMLAVLVFAAPTFAQASSFSIIDIFVTISSQISVQPGPELGGANSINLSTPVSQGEFDIVVPFRVDANSQEVFFTVNASNLYKQDDPNSPNFIPLDATKGVVLTSPTGQAGPLNGGSTTLPLASGPSVDGFPTLMTPTVEYQSSQAGVFSLEMDVTVWWNTTTNPTLGAQLPAGQYSGIVELTAAILPTTGTP